MSKAIDFDAIEWRFDDSSFLGTAQALLVINGKVWREKLGENVTAQDLADHIKWELTLQCRIDRRAIASLSTGGYVASATHVDYYPGQEPYIWARASLNEYGVNRWIERIQNAATTPV